jgi:hypothetical protein
LLVAQQIAGAANVEIVSGELEAGARLSRLASTCSRFCAVSVSSRFASCVK